MITKSLTDKQILRQFSGIETGGIRQCKHCEGWYSDDFIDLVEHLMNCKEYKGVCMK